MLRAFLIEDEAPARERLAAMLAETTPACAIAGAADSVAAAEAWLRQNAAPDLIFADIQLGDGLSLDLFRGGPPPCPVVFTTAHDAYMLEAFASHGIAYLLKPVKHAELEGALKKYQELGRHFAGGIAALAVAFSRPTSTPPGSASSRSAARRSSRSRSRRPRISSRKTSSPSSSRAPGSAASSTSRSPRSRPSSTPRCSSA